MHLPQYEPIMDFAQIKQTLAGANIELWNWYLPTDEIIFNKYILHRPTDYSYETVSRVSTFQGSLHPDEQTRVLEHIRLEALQDSSFELEHRVRDSENGWQWVLTQSHVIERDEHGEAIRMAGISWAIHAPTCAERAETTSGALSSGIKPSKERLQQHVDENKGMAQALAETETSLATLINNVDDSIFSIDRERHLINFNSTFERGAAQRYGIVLQKGMLLETHFHEAIRNVYIPLFERTLAGESVQASRRIRIPELGVDMHNEITCNPIRSVSGDVTGAAFYVRDDTKSKLAETALRESEERFRQVIENVPLAFYIYDLEQSAFVYTNPLFESTFRYVTGDDTLSLRAFYEHVHPDDRPPLLATLEIRTEKILSDSEYRVVFPSGYVRHLRQLTFTIDENDAQIVHMATFIEDVTERKHIEQALYRNERLLESVINHALHGIAAFWAIRDSNGRIVDFEYRLANPKMAQFAKCTPTELIGHRISQETPSTMTDRLFEQFVNVVDTGQILDTEYLDSFPSSLGYFRISGVKLEDGLVVTFADITEQKKNQIALIQNRTLLESILKNLPVGVMVTSLEGNVLSANNHSAALLKQQPEGLLYHNISEFFTADEMSVWNANNVRVLQSGQPVQNVIYERWRGDFRTLLVNLFPLRDVNDAILGVGRVIIDITEQKQIQDQLRELSWQIIEIQERERRHIARELHDEVGQSLTGVLLMLNQLEHATSDLNTTSIRHIQTLIRQLMGQIRELSHNLHPPILDKQGLFAALRWYCSNYTAQTQIQVMFKYTGSKRRLPSDIELTCYRIVQEALTNIARYARVNEARVSISAGPKRIKLVIQDSGIGFDVGANWSQTANFGLLSMRERISILGGTVDIQSSAGKGTQICADIPLSDGESR